MTRCETCGECGKDGIERLRAERDVLRDNNARLNDSVLGSALEIERLRAEVEGLQTRIAKLETPPPWEALEIERLTQIANDAAETIESLRALVAAQMERLREMSPTCRDTGGAM